MNVVCPSLCGVRARLSLVAFWSERIQCLLITTAAKSFQPEPEVSWGGIKNQSKSTWCQSALIQFSINKTFQTALKMAQEIYVFAHCHGERNYLTIIYLVAVKEVSLTPLFHLLTKGWIVCVRVDVGIPEIGLMPVNISFITCSIVEGTLATGAM